MKKPMKPKRYADGDVVEDDFKKKGLESSKGDRVSLLERLRMGSIDDPKSEAYRRYGAGRGRTDADTASRMKDRATVNAAPNQDISRMGNAPTESVQSPFLMGRTQIGGSNEDSDSGERRKIEDYITNKGGSSSESSEAVAPVKKRKSSSSLPRNKNAPGYQMDDNKPANIGNQNTFNFDLRKKSQTAPNTRSGGARTRAGTPVSNESDGKTRAGTKATGGDEMSVLGPAALGLLGMSMYKGMKDIKKKKEDYLNESRPSSMGTRSPRIHELSDPLMSMDMERMADEGGPNFKKGGKTRAKPMQKFASGGSISSASKRGDGIAQKGKTKGRIV
jgi:hypothetical protein